MTASTSTRLHITPLDAGLLPIVLGPHLIKIAKNISFQSIETFPENDYGFLDLPETDARNLTSKLNGAILKGKKMKVEKARPTKRSHDVVQEDNALDSKSSRKKARKSRKNAADEALDGYQLPTDRKVKRGWTEAKPDKSTRSKSKDKTKRSKRQAPSQYTEREELLFRTKLPPNKEHLDRSVKSSEEKKGKRGTGTVVHEFERTDIQPAFIRESAASGRATEYIDNIGWVDDKGDVIEGAPSSMSRKRPSTAEKRRIAIPISDGAKTLLDGRASSVGTTSSDQTSDSALSDGDVDAQLSGDATDDSDASASTSGSDSNEGSNDEDDGEQDARKTPQGRKKTSAKVQTPQKVHPLEALFKKPKPPDGGEAAKPSLEIETSFSFFNQSAANGGDELPPMPTTPFTSNDLRSREIRSAAPTPDTAHPSRFTSFASAMATRLLEEQAKDEATLEATGDDAAVPRTERPGERAQSDFEKRFWAERGQNNRAWKTRRKTALKEQRQKENRLRRPRNW